MTTQQSAAASGIQTPMTTMMTAVQQYPSGNFQSSARIGIPEPEQFLEALKRAIGD